MFIVSISGSVFQKSKQVKLIFLFKLVINLCRREPSYCYSVADRWFFSDSQISKGHIAAIINRNDNEILMSLTNIDISLV